MDNCVRIKKANDGSYIVSASIKTVDENKKDYDRISYKDVTYTAKNEKEAMKKISDLLDKIPSKEEMNINDYDSAFKEAPEK